MATGLSNSTITKDSSKEAIHEKVKSYFIQLTRGCGISSCSNPDCATGSGSCTDPNKAAAKAVMLAQQKAQLCVVNHKTHTKSSSTTDTLSNKISETSSRVAATAGADKMPLSPSTPNQHTDEPMEVEPTTELSHPSSQEDSPSQTSSTQTPLSKQSPSPQSSPVAMETANGMDAKKPKTEESRAIFPPRGTPGLSEKNLKELIDKGTTSDKDDPSKRTYKELTNTLWNIFSNPHLLNASFLLSEDELKLIHHKTGILVDVDAVRRSYQALFGLEVISVTNTLVNVMDPYSSAIKRSEELKMTAPLNHVVILLENPFLHSPEFTARAFPKLLNSIMSLALDQKATLVEWYASYSPERLEELVSSLQQLILITILEQTDDPSSKVHLQNDRAIAAATHTMMIFYVANLVIAKRKGYFRKHSTDLLSILAAPLPDRMHLKKLNIFQMLLSKFDVHPSEMLLSPISLDVFVNESVNNEVNMIADYKRQGHKTQDGTHTFCFLDHPFILTPANKVERLYVEHQLLMLNERHRTIFNAVLTGVPDLPFLLLRVDRDDLVNDTLAQLEAIADMNPADLRKQLRVEFRGEEGIDEGGLQKEFFQLLVEKLFDPMNGMFQFDEEQNFYRFNPSSLESEQQYHLIGILLGLAIYNSVILDVSFPMVVYHKLLGCSTVFTDLESSHPQIAKGFKSILEFEETESQSFQDTFMLYFTATYQDLFASLQTVPLKDGGETIPVTYENRAEFVELYADWLLNKSIASQFDAFKKGFDQVMGDSNLADLFTAEEIELLVCGNKEWDFNALEENTRYDGFTKDHVVIKHFWEVFNEFSDHEKKQLLAFVTGSDRVPVGGLAKLRMIIVKNGPDSDRLPTAHTCFNALLLCDYSSKEKLKDRLSKAISHGKGFGML